MRRFKTTPFTVPEVVDLALRGDGHLNGTCQFSGTRRCKLLFLRKSTGFRNRWLRAVFQPRVVSTASRPNRFSIVPVQTKSAFINGLQCVDSNQEFLPRVAARRRRRAIVITGFRSRYQFSTINTMVFGCIDYVSLQLNPVFFSRLVTDSFF